MLSFTDRFCKYSCIGFVLSALLITMAPSHAEQSARSSAKIGPYLKNLTFSKNTLSEEVASSPFVHLRQQNQAQAYIELEDIDQEVIRQLEEQQVSIEIVNQDLAMIQGWVPLQQIDSISSLAQVKRIRIPSYARQDAGQFTSEGDAILRSDQLRATGLLGAGVKVGIISDGANNWTTASASGDLPATITTYGSCTVQQRNVSACLAGKTCNEGTAMAEIVHDLAPQAEIAVAAASTSLEFIQRINQLANNFKANIIVDDLKFYAEPFFADGDIAQAVAALPDNIIYITSAGNAGDFHYEDQFRPNGGTGAVIHEFSSGVDRMEFIVPAQGYTMPTLQWNDPFDNPLNNYDLLIATQTGFVYRTDTAPATKAKKSLCIPNLTNVDIHYDAIVKRTSGNTKRIELFFVSSGELGSDGIEFNQASGSVFGHAGIPSVITVGAINAAEPGNNGIAPYSSRGPSRIDFPSLSVRAKPDLVAIDGVMVSGAGGFPSPFFGTSAAAPHVAGIAALLMSSQSRFDAKKVKEALTLGAIDLGPTGHDPSYGFGRVDAIMAKSFLKPSVVLPPFLILLDD